jgi:enamine deaminase RidA (YjgF/YER057c/UK114 family)
MDAEIAAAVPPSSHEYENMNSVYREFFPADPPARTVCGVKLIGGHKVEIDCIALAEAAEPGAPIGHIAE